MKSIILWIVSLSIIAGIIIMSIGYPLNNILLVVFGIILTIVGVISLNIIYYVLKRKSKNKNSEQAFVIENPIQVSDVEDQIEIVKYNPQIKYNNSNNII